MGHGACTCALLLSLCLFVASGSTVTIARKMLYDTDAEGRHGAIRSFQKPWAVAFISYLVQLMCLIPYLTRRAFGSRGPGQDISDADTDTEGPLCERDGSGPIGGAEGRVGEAPLCRAFVLLLWPAATDVAQSFLKCTALLYVDASVTQIFSPQIICTALLRRCIGKRDPRPYQWFGIAVVTAALSLIGLSQLLGSAGGSGSGSGSESGAPRGGAAARMLGLALALAAISAENVLEERVLSTVRLPPTALVGIQGCWGALLCGGAMCVAQQLPGEEGKGLHEDSWDTLLMLRDGGVQCWLAVCCVAYVLQSVAEWLVLARFASHTRSIFAEGRGAVVWVAMLAIHRASPSRGEEWTSWSWLQLGGFAVFMTGMCIFQGIIRLPQLFAYPELKDASPGLQISPQDRTVGLAESPGSEGAGNRANGK